MAELAKTARGRNEEGKRTARIPLGAYRQKLSIPPEKQAEMEFKGAVPRWINDRGGRLSDALAGGYSFETDPKLAASVGGGENIAANPGTDSRISRIVGTDEAGNPVRAYLMSIPKDLYDKDKAEQAAEIDKLEEGMKRGKDKEGRPYVEGHYTPKDGPKMEYRTGKDADAV